MVPLAAAACGGTVHAPLGPASRPPATDRRAPLTFGESRFAPALAAPSAAERRGLDAVARVLRRAPAVRVVIEGHTDARGDGAANLRLGLRRAEWVRDYLARRDVPRERMTAHSYGATRPVGANDTAEGRASNRRVEILASAAIVE